MGIPSYFSYIVRNHGGIIKKLAKLDRVVDNLYLDSNSIIYDVYRTITTKNKTTHDIEVEIYAAICEKIESYISTVEPKNRVIIAFDGVAPVAKLEQQRNRRYKSNFEKQLFKELTKIPQTETNWDQCSITPGTNFMNNLGTQVNSFFQSKNDLLNVKEILVSCTNEAGEGEHKIFEFIRNNEETHKNELTLIYGLDADLIMLCLNHLSVSNSIYLYRETPHFIKNIDRDLNPEEEYVVNIPELADAIINEMNNFRSMNSSQKNNRLHDYIFLCFFLGNDFMPHIPSVNIRTTGIEILLNAYKETLGNTKEYLTDGKNINWKNVRKLVEVLKRDELSNLKSEYHGRRKMEKRVTSQNETIEDKLTFIPIRNRAIEEYINPFEYKWEARYYKTLFDMDITRERKQQICTNYLEALEWTMKYYTTGCYNWDWCYHFNYAPLMSDLYQFMPCFDVEFVEKKEKDPLPPLVQLSYVLPKHSFDLLPNHISKKLLDTNADWYDTNCDFQWAYCKYFWESHVIMKPINISELKEIVCC